MYCRPMQIRSFASKMHNDGTFQYFALDFGHTRAAIHGSVVLAQAEFLNEALKTIARLYSMKNGWKYLIESSYFCFDRSETSFRIS